MNEPTKEQTKEQKKMNGSFVAEGFEARGLGGESGSRVNE